MPSTGAMIKCVLKAIPISLVWLTWHLFQLCVILTLIAVWGNAVNGSNDKMCPKKNTNLFSRTYMACKVFSVVDNVVYGTKCNLLWRINPPHGCTTRHQHFHMVWFQWWIFERLIWRNNPNTMTLEVFPCYNPRFKEVEMVGGLYRFHFIRPPRLCLPQY